MNRALIKIKDASTWDEYYQAYKSAYSDLLKSHWALGVTSFARNIHHTAVPDVSGSTAGLVNWAVYSQPSLESFLAFLPVFAGLIQSEPKRIGYKRYIFFIAEGVSPSRDIVKAALGTIGNKLDFWCISLEDAFSFPISCSQLLGLDALLGEGTWANHFIFEKQDILRSNKLEFLEAAHRSAIDQLPIGSTIAHKDIVSYLIDSFIILLAFNLSINPNLAVEIIGGNAAFTVLIALERAQKSNWPKEAETYCNAIKKVYPLKTIPYIVRPGDTLSLIIRINYELPYHLLWPLISVVNPEITDPNHIKAGQRILLPEISEELPIFRR